MPIIQSAKKRVKVAAKANTRNSKIRRNVRETLKAYTKALQSGKPAEVAKTQRAAISALDVAAKKAVIHKNKAARKKSQLVAAAKAAGIKPTKAETSKPKAKTPAKPAAKKTPAKKPTAKK